MQFTSSVDILKDDCGVFMLVKSGPSQHMTVLFALLITHGSTLVAGKRLVRDEAGYKYREVLCSPFFFITDCLWQFTKT